MVKLYDNSTRFIRNNLSTNHLRPNFTIKFFGVHSHKYVLFHLKLNYQILKHLSMITAVVTLSSKN